MARPIYRGHIIMDDDQLDFGLTGLLVVGQGSDACIVAWAPTAHVLIALDIAAGRIAHVADMLILEKGDRPDANREIALIAHDGAAVIVAASDGGGSIGYGIDAQARFGARLALPGLDAPQAGLVGLVQPTDDMFYTLLADGTLCHLRADGDGYGDATRDVRMDGPAALAWANVGGTDYVLAAGRGMGGVAAFRADGGSGRLDATGAVGTDEGLGIMTPTALEVATLMGRSFVVLLSAAGNGGAGGALSVMELTASGALVPMDHAGDTRTTRFGAASDLAVVEVAGRVQVIAGGGDDGMSLFELTPDGRLLHRASVANDGTNGLDNVAGLAAVRMGGEMQLFTTSQTGAGIGQWAWDISALTAPRVADAAGGTLAGGTGDDLLMGGAGDDRLSGGAGDDILIAGLGRDTLNGGQGDDTFMLEPDATPDRIEDFEVGHDTLDLSRFRMLYDPAQLGYRETSQGAVLDWRDQTITVLRHGGGSLALEDLFPYGFDWAHHSYLPSELPDYDDGGTGDGGGETDGGTGSGNPAPPPTAINTKGSDAADLMTGTGLDDTLLGGNGDDTLSGAAGDDYLHGERGNDTVIGGSGDDTVIGGPGDDRVEGGDGNDRLTGGNGRDTLIGGAGDDLFFAQAGDDYVIGGDGRDSVHLGIGDDIYEGRGGGNDTVRGLAGHDTIIGGDGDDLLFGHLGHDVIDGGFGNDTIRAGIAHDHIMGGPGDDLLDAAPGWDTLEGGDGDDTLIGHLGNDLMTGGRGADTFVFTSRSGWDTVTDYEDGTDILSITHPGQSFDSITMSQVGADVTIWYGLGGIVLEDTQVWQLGPDDFLFA